MKRWKAIAGFEGVYEVSDHGDVRRLAVLSNHGGYRPRKLRARELSLGATKYPTVTLHAQDGTEYKARVHVLVAKAFVPGSDEWNLVRHLDDDPWNNHWRNLAWGTHQDNSDDRKRLKTTGRVLTHDDVVFIKARLAKGIRGDARLLARHYEVTEATICSIRKGRMWRHV